MTVNSQTLALGWQAYQSGNLPLAEQLLRKLLETDPANAVAWCILGVIGRAHSRLDQAATCFRRALAVRPDYVEAITNLGVVLREQGQLAEAVACYRHALTLQPQDSGIHNNLGNVLQQQGQLLQAVACYRQALALRPDYVEAHNNLGNVLQAQGQLVQAVACFRQALAFRPRYVEALNNLGNALLEQGQAEEAVGCYRQALQLRPGYAEAHNNLGNALRELGQAEEAVACYRQALHLRPDYPNALNNLGNALKQLRQWEEAQACYRRALALQPNYAEAQNGLGNWYQEQARWEEATACYQHALALKPTYAEAHNNLGIVLLNQGRLEEAGASYRRALALQPDFAEAYTNFANFLTTQRQMEEAAANYRRALVLKPHFANGHKNWSLFLLLTGNLEEGWKEFEWRLRCQEVSSTVLPQPRWDGAALQGRTILLNAEQGLGDTLQFIRYAILVKQCGGTVIVACQKPLLRILASCAGIDYLMAQGSQLPPADVQAPMLSLPGIFRTSLATIPAQVPYLSAKPELVAHWRGQLAAVRGYRVGISWQGSPLYGGDRLRSVPVHHFSRLAHVEGVQLISLQKGPGASHLSALKERFPVLELGDTLDEASGAFMDTAAVMKNLDLIITSDTAIPHLAGALGVPVWVALPFTPDWRFLLDRKDSPWYPTMRLFRQTEPGNWAEVFARLAVELEKQVGANAATPP